MPVRASFYKVHVYWVFWSLKSEILWFFFNLYSVINHYCVRCRLEQQMLQTFCCNILKAIAPYQVHYQFLSKLFIPAFQFCCCNLSEMLSNINPQPIINEVKFCRITHICAASGYFQNKDATLLWEWVDVTPTIDYMK